MSDHDAELDALAAQLTGAGYIVVVERPDGGVSYQLTSEGARVARQMAMSSEDAQDPLLDALDVLACRSAQEGDGGGRSGRAR